MKYAESDAGSMRGLHIADGSRHVLFSQAQVLPAGTSADGANGGGGQGQVSSGGAGAAYYAPDTDADALSGSKQAREGSLAAASHAPPPAAAAAGAALPAAAAD